MPGFPTSRSRTAVCLALLFSTCLAISTALAQTVDIHGTVYDSSTRDPLVFANILVVGSTTGTVTDAQGKYTLALPIGAYTLRCSFVGYKTATTTLSVQGPTQCSFALQSLDVVLQDVTVYANHDDHAAEPEANVLTLQSETIRQSTSLMADVLRSVQMLPGVANNNELSAKFDVHGGDANENLVLINGTQVYEPYHVKEAPNVSVGIFNPDMIKKMDLSTGGFSARYGDRMSSVLTIDYREGRKDRIGGQASLSMTDVNALVEGPVGEDGSFIFGARQSYLEYVTKLIDVSSQIHPSFYDIQGVLGYHLTPVNQVSIKFIHAGDAFRQDPIVDISGSRVPSFRTSTGLLGSLAESWHDSSTMVAAQSTNILSSNVLVRGELSYYDQRETATSREQDLYSNMFHSGSVNAFYNSTYDRVFDNLLRIQTLEASLSAQLQLTPMYGLRLGGSFQRIMYDRSYSDKRTLLEVTNQLRYPAITTTAHDLNPQNSDLDTVDTHSSKTAAYIENVFQVEDWLTINAGGRFDHFALDRQTTWSPRLLLAAKLTPALTLRGAWGHYYQFPVPAQLASSNRSDTNTRAQRAIHYVVGVEYNIAGEEGSSRFLKTKLEVFYKKYDHLISSTISTNNDEIDYSKHNDAVGRANGFDVYLGYATGRLSGWLSYAFLTSEQKYTVDSIGWFPRNTDQRHTLAAVMNWDAGKEWTVSLRGTFGSGFPYTPMVPVYDRTRNSWSWQVVKPNSGTMPAYRRVDVRFAKQFTLFGLPASAFLDVSNVLNFQNVQTYNYEFDDHGQPEVEEVTLWPILPTLGLSVQF